MEENKGSRKKTRYFLIVFACLIVISLLNWGVITGWGNVRITRLSSIGEDGLRYSALMYVPKTATTENPAPAIFMSHGMSGSARNHESWAVEFSRRGFVVLSDDNRGAGDGELNSTANGDASKLYWCNYLYNLPITDKERFVISGHSAGGDTTIMLLNNGVEPTLAFLNDGGRSAIRSLKTVPAGTSVVGIWGGDDKAYPPSTAIQIGTAIAQKMGYKVGSVSTKDKKTGETTTKTLGPDFELEKVYGSYADHNLIYFTINPDQIHEGVFVSRGHIEIMLREAQACFEVPNYIDEKNQVWFWKDVLGQLGMIALAAFIMTFADMMMEQFDFFKGIRQPLPRNIGMRGIPLAISVVCAIGFPFLCMYLGSFGLVDLLGLRSPNGKLFHLTWTNGAFGLLVALNLFGLFMFFVYHFTWGKKNFKARLADYGLTSLNRQGLDFVLIGKSLLLAILSVFAGWTFISLQGKYLGTDFYCMFWGYKPIAAGKFIYYIPYIIGWCLCFLIAALGMNVERRLPSTGRENQDTVIAMVVNVFLAAFSITFMVLLEDFIQHKIGATSGSLASWKTDFTRIWGMPAGMIIGVAGNTYLYRKSGSVYLGAFTMGILCALGACLYGQLVF